MRVEGRSGWLKRWRPVLAVLLVVTALLLPTWLWVVKGRKVPLEVILDPPAFVLQARTALPLHPRILPAVKGIDLMWSFDDQGQLDEKQAVWRAPAKSGLVTISLRARRAGSEDEDAVTVQVVPRSPGSYPLVRPAPGEMPQTWLSDCPNDSSVRVALHGRPCRNGNLVVEVVGADGSRIWHWLDRDVERAVEGRMANMLLVQVGRTSVSRVTSMVVPRRGGCAHRLITPVAIEDCDAGPAGQDVFADFSWMMISPGRFRLAAKPSRSPAAPFSRYIWDFGDGGTKETIRPVVTHQFQGFPTRWRLVTLEVVAAGGRATVTRAVTDRSVAAE